MESFLEVCICGGIEVQDALGLSKLIPISVQDSLFMAMLLPKLASDEERQFEGLRNIIFQHLVSIWSW